MKLGSKRTFLGATAIAVACLLGAAAHAQTAQEKLPMTDEVFKSVMLLKGIPVDTFFEAMGMFANAMGNDCTFCHASEAVFDKAKFARLDAENPEGAPDDRDDERDQQAVLRRPDPR